MSAMQFLRAAALLVAAMAAPVRAHIPARTQPQRIVSLNMCADQLVLALADRSQIAGLTRNAPDRDMSAEAARTPGLHILGSSAEEIFGIHPDLVVGMPASGSTALTALAGQH